MGIIRCMTHGASRGKGYKEINIVAGTLDRPIEYTVATMLHEMCHQYNNEILNVQDCSRCGTYHNKHFRNTALQHGLDLAKTDKYGWSKTSPSDISVHAAKRLQEAGSR